MKLLLALVASTLTVVLVVQSAPEVEKKDFSASTKYEHVIAGPLKELNGKYKLRISENTFAPGGYIGKHNHAGPGIRLVESGELTYIEGDSTTIFKAGEYFFEPGDNTHSGYNKTDKPLKILSFELLPVDWTSGSAIPPRTK